MDRLEIVRKYVKENPEIDQKLAPNLVTYTRGTNKAYGKYVKIHELKSGRIFYNIYKGFDFREWGWPKHYLDIETISAQNGASKLGLYMNYVDELQMLELGAVIIDISRVNDKLNIDKRLWKLCGNSRYFIFNDDKVAYREYNGSVGEYGMMGKFYNYGIFNMLKELGGTTYTSTKKQFEEFNAFINGTREGNTNPKVYWGCELNEAYRKLYRKDKHQEEKELFNKVDKELKNINDFELPSTTFDIYKSPHSGTIQLVYNQAESVIYDKDSENNDIFRSCVVKNILIGTEEYVKIMGKIRSLKSYKVPANVGKSFTMLCDFEELRRLIIKDGKVIEGDISYNLRYSDYGNTITDKVREKYINDIFEKNNILSFTNVYNAKYLMLYLKILNLDDMLKEPKFKAHEAKIRELANNNTLTLAGLYMMGCFS